MTKEQLVSKAKEAISSLMQDPKVKKMMEEMGR